MHEAGVLSVPEGWFGQSSGVQIWVIPNFLFGHPKVFWRTDEPVAPALAVLVTGTVKRAPNDLRQITLTERLLRNRTPGSSRRNERWRFR